MVLKSVDQVLKENIDRKLSAETNRSTCRDNQKSESVEYNPELYGIDWLNLKESVNDGLKDPEIWFKQTFGREPKNIYDMNYIHYNNVNNIDEFNLLHNILTTYIFWVSVVSDFWTTAVKSLFGENSQNQFYIHLRF